MNCSCGKTLEYLVVAIGYTPLGCGQMVERALERGFDHG
jgi:hypothetical protein